MPQNRLTQDVKTRWRSTHDMTNALRVNNEALLLYDVRNPGAAKGFVDNRYSLVRRLIDKQPNCRHIGACGCGKQVSGRENIPYI